MISAFHPAAAGLAVQYDRFARSAARVATPEPPADLVHETIESVSAQNGARANLAVIKTADGMLGYLFDIWA